MKFQKPIAITITDFKKVMLILFLSFSATICAAQFSVEKGNIPASFSGFKGTLLIERVHSKGLFNGPGYLDGVNDIMEKRFNKHYKGEFEMVEAEETSKSRYKDTKNFPFVLQLIFDHHTPDKSTYYYKFNMIDRSTSKEYETDTYPDSTIPPYSFINAYAKALGKLRGKE